MAADQGVEILEGPADLPHRNFDETVGSQDVMCGSVLCNESYIYCVWGYVKRDVSCRICDLQCVEV